MIVAGFALCIAIGYAIGRNDAPRQPFPLLGTPIELPASTSEPSAANQPLEANTPLTPPASGSSSIVATRCGARTKSGKPCQRKVAGGGYCYQHRDKYGAKKKEPDGK